jgi:hypothetical protein
VDVSWGIVVLVHAKVPGTDSCPPQPSPEISKIAVEAKRLGAMLTWGREREKGKGKKGKRR